ncbi:MAG: dienelactone hydrolase family protein [Bryobacteraceae bacterium]
MSHGSVKFSRRAALAAFPAVSLTRGDSEEQLDSPNSKPDTQSSTPPVMGNLFETLGTYMRQTSPSYAYDPARWPNLQAWKREARLKCLEHLAYHPPAAPFNAEIRSKRKRNGYVQEELVFYSSPGVQVPASLLIPQGPAKKYPALVALHDHGGYFYSGREKLLERDKSPAVLDEFCQKIYDGVPYAAELARAGYVVLVIDAFYFGDRRLRETSVPKNAETRALTAMPSGTDEYIRRYNVWAKENEQATAKTIFLAGATWPGIIGFDDMRSVDYLLTRPEVDTSRVGCLGLSLGGFRAAYLAGLHDAIRSSVVTCWMTAYEPMLASYAARHTWMIHAPGLYQDLDLPDVVCMTAPNHLLVQYGRQDTLFPNDGKQLAANKIKHTYDSAGVAANCRHIFYDKPHMFSKQMQHDALEWFGKTLGA